MNTTDHGFNRATSPGHSPASAIPEADCEKVATVLDKVETGNASSEEVDYLIDHAQDCSPCFQSIEKQRLFIGFLQGNLHHKGVPTALATAIRETIAREAALQ
jgi:hypothetical protein